MAGAMGLAVSVSLHSGLCNVTPVTSDRLRCAIVRHAIRDAGCRLAATG